MKDEGSNNLTSFPTGSKFQKRHGSILTTFHNLHIVNYYLQRKEI